MKMKEFLFAPFLIFSFLIITTSCKKAVEKALVKETSTIEILQENDVQEQPIRVETQETILPEFDQTLFEQDLTILDDDQKAIVIAYLDVLQNKDKFFQYLHFYNFFGNGLKDYDKDDIYKGEYKTVSEYLERYVNDPHTFYIDEFTVLDMDGDSIPDVILNTQPSYDRLLLRYENGTVCGYGFGIRGLNRITKEGAYSWSNGAADSGYSKLQSISGVLEVEELYDLSYYEYSKKEEQEWYIYSIDTISKVLLAAWDNLNYSQVK
jgi:hypothetical protein